ncbi:hypothetical protein GOP47_0027304 [Adiantum capillus-veneris]|nr:hypothetical protein GOP47_0027304 [Adiantum capillus-veneris]
MRAEMGKDPTRAPSSQLNLPAGFRFYPTDEELVVHYLCKKAACEPFAVPIIAEIELYKYDPWDLPEKALFGEREWYFFSPRDRKYPNGSRPNRAAGTGYWKATGTDKPISTIEGSKKVGVKKALVFYKGKAPKGIKTNWIMHEYRLADTHTPRSTAKRKSTLRLDDWVLCRIYKKSTSAANELKSAFDGMRGEQSESSGLDEVLATLSEFDDPIEGVPGDLEEACTDAMEQFNGASETKASSCLQFGASETRTSSSLQSSLERLYHASASAYSSQEGDLRNYMQKALAQEQARIMTGGEVRLKQLGYSAEAASFNMWDNAATPESYGSSRQHSSLESHSTSGKHEEEDLTVESTFNSLAGLPSTRLLSTSLNTHNLGMAGNSSPFGLDLGLPSPCTMLAQGASFGGSLIDPDNYFFQSSNLTSWDSARGVLHSMASTWRLEPCEILASLKGLQEFKHVKLCHVRDSQCRRLSLRGCGARGRCSVRLQRGGVGNISHITCT